MGHILDLEVRGLRDAPTVPVPEGAEARVVVPGGGRTYEYARHLALLALGEQLVVAKGTHVALPHRARPLTSVDVPIEAVRIFWLWNIYKVIYI